MTAPVIRFETVVSGYGDTVVLHGLDFAVAAGEVVAILGRNGAGKTTSLKTLMGLLACRDGEIRFKGESLAGQPPHRIAKRGLAYVPETRDIFPSLSVAENLALAEGFRDTAGLAYEPWTRARVIELFPFLAKRLGNGGTQLSGGEQQMLAIGRALLMNPDVLVLDEPTEGLAPIIIAQIHDTLDLLKQKGMTVLLVEQNFGFATSLADRCVVIGRGVVQWQGTPAEIHANPNIQHRWLGV